MPSDAVTVTLPVLCLLFLLVGFGFAFHVECGMGDAWVCVGRMYTNAATAAVAAATGAATIASAAAAAALGEVWLNRGEVGLKSR